MARITKFQDDYSGELVSADAITPDYRFSLGTEKWCLDATPGTQAAMRAALEPFITKARIVMTGRPAADPIPVSGNGTTSGNGHANGISPAEVSEADIKAWARSVPAFKGKVKVQGRPTNEMREAYALAH